MKVIFFVALMVMFGIIAMQAQENFYVNPDTSISQGDPSNSVLFNYAWIHNLTPDTMWLNWKRINMDVSINWEMNICDEWTCYSSDIIEGSFYIMANDSSPVVCQFYTNNSIGMGSSQLTIWQLQDSINNTFTATYLAYILPVSITENDLNSIVKIFPNPANDKLHISISENSILDHLFLIDLRGNIVREKKMKRKSCEFDIRNLPSSTYVLSGIHNNRIKFSKKVIVNR